MSGRCLSRSLITLSLVSGLAALNPAVFAGSADATISVFPNIVAIAYSTTSPTITVQLSEAPASDVTVNLSLSGTAASGATLSTSALVFGPGETSKTYTFTSGPNLGTLSITYSLSGTNAAGYTAPAPMSMNVLGRVTIGNVPGSLSTGQTSAAITVTMSHAAIDGLTVGINLSGTAAAGSSATPASLTFAPGETVKPFQVTTGSTAGSLTLSFPNSGPDAASFAPTANRTITVNTANTPVGTNVSVTPVPSSPMPVSVTITYGQVTSAGTTSIGTPPSVPAAPSGFMVVGGGLYFGLATTAGVIGPHQVCATYASGLVADETSLRLFQRTGLSTWTDRTSTVDPSGHVICGTISTLGTFGIFTLNTAPQVGAITGPAGNVSAGETHAFSATFTDADAGDTHTGTWVWGDDTTSPAVITNVDGVWTATGEHAFAADGTYQAALIISDGGQHTRSADFEVTVGGSAEVLIESVTASPKYIWPPDGKMHEVTLTVSATHGSATPVCVISGVSMPGLSASDYAVTGDLTLQLKAFPHRAYAITVTCTGSGGATADKTVIVTVEHEKKDQ